ncbi:putative protein YyaP [Sporomusa rhizae]|uniref:dihydrofolate reductase family protein n=1 Tax=Sporomusa rhizae TaxID=357999 RepID=UPI00352A917E
MLKPASNRKIILDLAVTLDGFIEGPNGEVDWCIMDPDMGFSDFLNDIDTILYGRKSYDLWGQYSPGNEVSNPEKEIWELVHNKKKYVFSKTLTKVDGKAELINNNIEEEVNKLKNQPGKDIWLYGGASLITTFVNLGLVDEYRLAVHPVILGAGKPLFVDIKQRVGLKLTNVKRFSSGVVQLCYQPSNGIVENQSEFLRG